MYVLLVALLALSPSAGSSAPPEGLVRIRPPLIEGTLLAVVGDTILVETGIDSRAAIPIRPGMRLEVRRLIPKTREGFTVGFLVGMIAGFALSYEDLWTATDAEDSFTNEATVFGMAFLGGAFGAILGATCTKEEWIEVPLGSPADPRTQVGLGVRMQGGETLVRVQGGF